LSRQEQRRAAANARAELAPMRKRIQSYEREIETITRKLEELDAQLGSDGLYEDQPEKALTLMKERGELAKALGETEILWLEASERYEQARPRKEKANSD
jgi:ATP-binding cassette subfamily F protein 3